MMIPKNTLFEIKGHYVLHFAIVFALESYFLVTLIRCELTIIDYFLDFDLINI